MQTSNVDPDLIIKYCEPAANYYSILINQIEKSAVNNKFRKLLRDNRDKWFWPPAFKELLIKIADNHEITKEDVYYQGGIAEAHDQWEDITLPCGVYTDYRNNHSRLANMAASAKRNNLTITLENSELETLENAIHLYDRNVTEVSRYNSDNTYQIQRPSKL